MIHRILHPNPKRLAFDPNKLNKFFAATAERTLGTTPSQEDEHEEIEKLIDSLPLSSIRSFDIRPVRYEEVLKELRDLRNDCSTGPDQIPVKMLKPVADILASPLTNIINTGIEKHDFPTAWKTARICAIPKGNQVTSEQDLRPISILPALSKVYERLIFRQITTFNEEEKLMESNISAYRKGQSTMHVLQEIRDDIIKAMQRGEVTMMILADFSKAFNTIKFQNLIKKMNHLGFSKNFLKWTLNYVSKRKHFVQIDDRVSERIEVRFGVPQGSILGPVLFNIYVADLQSEMKMKGYQYADDTTLYCHAKPKNLEFLSRTTNQSIEQLGMWASNNNLALNREKTKLMVLSTQEMSRRHGLEDIELDIHIKGKKMERTETCKLLGVTINEHLKWENHVKIITSSCYGTLSILRKLKNVAPFRLRKQLAESLVLAKIDYGDQVYTPLTVMLQKRLQRVQFAAASFVTGHYVKGMEDILKLGWLPIEERRDFNLLKQVFKALNSETWPDYLQLNVRKNKRDLRSNGSKSLEIPRKESRNCQDNAAKLFNSLPEGIRNCSNYNTFLSLTNKFLVNRAQQCN